MTIDILTVLPELLESPFNHSILKRAKDKGLLEIRVHPLRQWAVNEYGQVDDYQYGGGAGMVIMPEPLSRAIEALSRDTRYDEIGALRGDRDFLSIQVIPIGDNPAHSQRAPVDPRPHTEGHVRRQKIGLVRVDAAHPPGFCHGTRTGKPQ